jgi:pimeloyl-ACP methyl ester carboxylesterase
MRKNILLLCPGAVNPHFLVPLFWATLFLACNHPGPSVNNQGVPIAYTDTGKGDTTLLFVHGWCLNRTYWSNQVAFFKDRYRVVAVDLPGFGESGKNREDWTPGAFGGDIDSVMSQLHLRNVVLVGHSMAGDIVVQAALHAPDRVIGLVGVDNFKHVGAETTEEKNEDAMAITLLKQQFREAAFQLFQQTLFYETTPDSIRKRILTDVANTDSVIATACLAHLSTDETGPLAAYGGKLYLINSDYTTTDTAALRAARIPYEISYIRGTGHFPMVEKPAVFNERLQGVLAKLGH